MAINDIYKAEAKKEYRSGRVLMPMSTGKPKIVRLHAEYEIQRLPFNIVTMNGMPDIPAPELPGMTLLDGDVSIGVPSNHVTMASHSVHGEYLFASTSGETKGVMEMVVGTCPSDRGIIEQAKLEPRFFVSLVTGKRST